MSQRLVRPFQSDDLDEAARLLAARHAAHMQAFPQLDAAFADPAGARLAIADLLSRPDASGAVAMHGDELTAYVIGYSKADPSWGRNMWVEAAGSASSDVETLRAAYAEAATVWVENGRTAHYVLVPSTDRAAIDAWSRLAFGQQHAHALRLTSDSSDDPIGLEVRRANAGDLDALARLEPLLPQHQAQSPVFSATSVPTYEEALEDWRGEIEDESSVTVVAVVHGQVVGAAYGCDLAKSRAHNGLARVPNAAYFAWVVVIPDNRGAGIGRALEHAVTDWAASQGYPVIVTDWRVTNLLSSRAWPAAGYRQTFVRMHRLVGY